MRKREGVGYWDECASLGGKDGGSENPVAGSVDNNFHEPRRFAAFNGARHISHRAFPDFQLETFCAGFFFRHADAAELRIGEDAVRHGPIFGCEILSFHQIAVNNLEIVIGDVRESRAALAVAEGPNAWNVCLKAAIHFYKDTLAGFDSGLVEPEIVCIWTAPGGDQGMRAGHSSWAAGSLERKRAWTGLSLH